MADQVAASGPQTRIDPAVEQRLAQTGTLVRWVAAIYATLALIGVALDEVAALLPSGPVFLRDLPAAGAWPLAVLAWGAVLAGETRRSTRKLPLRRSGNLVAAFAAAYGVYVIAVYAIRFPSLWPWDPSVLALPALWVALMFVVLGVSLLLSTSRIEERVVSGQVGALVVFSTNAVIFLGYVYGDVSVGRLFRPPEITFQAAVISLLIAVGIILMRPGSGILATASSPEAGGRLLRRFGPVILLLPALLLLVVEAMPPTDRLDALAFVSVGLGLFLLVLLAVVVRVIDETKIEASTAEADAERARIGLEQEAPLVRNVAEALHIVDLPDRTDLDVATRYRPGRGSMAGDASAVRVLPDGSIAVVLVDMTGHGAEPAIRAIRVRDLLVHSLALGRAPSDAMGLVGWSAPGGVLASAVVARVDPESGAVVLASAGHPPTILVGAQDVELIEATGPLLYLDPDADYGEVRFELAPGDTLVLVSDGIADVQRLRDGKPEPNVLADALLAEGGVAARSAELTVGFADPEPTDDQTALVIRRVP